jgi:hypothetical protein
MILGEKEEMEDFENRLMDVDAVFNIEREKVDFVFEFFSKKNVSVD